MADFDYLATRNEIIQRAMRIVGALEPGQTLSAEMLDQGVEGLQQLVKDWSNDHLFLWTHKEDDFSTVATQELYNSELDQTIIGIDKAWIVDSNVDIPLEVISFSTYKDIREKELSGRPTHLTFRSTPEPSLYLWPVPDAVYTVKTLNITPLKDFDDASESGDVPARFQKALVYGLAEDLFDEYPGPMNEREFIAGKADRLFRKAKRSDMPVETTDEVEGFYVRRYR